MERASKLFDRLIVGVGVNIEKQTLFTPEERHAMIHEATAHLENVEIRTFTGLAVSFVKQCGARIMVRGVRPITDIAAELTMMMANRRLAPDVETLFMIADGELAHVSSSLIKQIASVANDEELARFLPPNVVHALRLRVGTSRIIMPHRFPLPLDEEVNSETGFHMRRRRKAVIAVWRDETDTPLVHVSSTGVVVAPDQTKRWLPVVLMSI